MPLSDHATQGSDPSTTSSRKSSGSTKKESLREYRLAVNGYGTMIHNGHFGASVDKQRDIPIRERLRLWAEQWSEASGHGKGTSSSISRPTSDVSSKITSEYYGSIGSLRASHLSSAQNTDLPNRQRQASGSEDAFHKLSHAISHWYKDWLKRWASSALPNREDEEYQSTTGTASSGREQSQQQQQRKDKRRREEEEQSSNKHGGDKRGGSGGMPPAKKSRDAKLRLACPFFKRDGIQCGLCGAEFSSQSSFQEHQREPGACERQEFELLEGIDALTKMKLQDKKVARGATEEAKWLAIYALLFPNDDPSTYPDPYYDVSPVLRQQIATFLQDEMPSVVQNAINHVTNNIETRTAPAVSELQIAITASINSSLRRFWPEQESSMPNISIVEASSHSQTPVFMEGSVEATRTYVTEDLLQQLQAELENEPMFVNTHEAESIGYYLDQLESFRSRE
ncbi:hypothetical protein E0Z10_g10412 [Xylaria hypoxylon]|uniref:C2H2-type domain-containing protein n=1 Tax=Xylaria hypoxylon TaxID=37992 RepID=A0A4Z0YNX3_9PEZI|nr:hypothetical protein E0Z10_g10412 [Xylaria hypoxylon]